MAKPFDPYHVWLGIPPKDQPPNDYRLLGIELFEDNPDVIDAAANRQTSYLHEMAAGPNRRHSQELLNGIAAARMRLLDSDRKARYDERLRGELDQQGTSEPDASMPGVANSDLQIEPSPFPIQLRHVNDSPAADSKSAASMDEEGDDPGASGKRKLAFIAIGSGTLVVTVIVGALLLSGTGSDELAGPSTGGGSAGGSFVKADNTTAGGATDDSDSAAGSFGQVSLAIPMADQAVDASQPEASATVALNSASGTENQVASWTFDEKNPQIANDSSDDRPALKLHGSPAFIAGPFDSAVQLDGKDDWIAMPRHVINPAEGTAAFWIRRDVDTSKVQGLMTSAPSGCPYNVSLDSEGRLKVQIGPGPKSIASTVILKCGVWYHVAVSWKDGGVCTLFCNAKPIGSIDRTGPLTKPKELKLGASGTTNANVVAAVSLDDVRVFNVALDAKRLSILLQQASVTLEEPEPFSSATRVIGNNPKNSSPPGRPPAPTPVRPINLPPASKNTVMAEYWTGLSGNGIPPLKEMIELKPKPTGTRSYDRLAMDNDQEKELGDNWGQRVKGFLLPPASGKYLFEGHFDDAGAFYLSRDSDPVNSKPVFVVGQNSGERILNAGEAYYFEVYHRENAGLSSFQIGWTLPDGNKELPIPGNRLAWSPHYNTFVTLPVVEAKSEPDVDLTISDDFLVVAKSTEVRSNSVYTLDLKAEIPEVTAFRVVALKNETIRGRGPGLGRQGMFGLAEISLQLIPADESRKPQLLSFQEPLATDGPAAFATDGRNETRWTIRDAKDATALYLPLAEPLKLNAGDLLRFTMTHEDNLACFRIRATAMNSTLLARHEQTYPKTTRRRSAAKQKLRLYVNLGGSSPTDALGKTWVPTKPFVKDSWGHVGGRPVRVDEIPDQVQRSAIEGISSFRATVNKGSYNVVLFFSENWLNGDNQRVFTVSAEGKSRGVLDVRARTGEWRKPFSFPINGLIVRDGVLNIDFAKTNDSPGVPILNAISIEQR